MLMTSCRPFPTSRFLTAVLSTLLFLFAAGVAEPGLAAEPVVSPLAPPDTSSPRATLKSFRQSMDTTFRPFYDSNKVPIPKGTPAFDRAVRSLDTSHLPPATARRLGAEAAILLNEVLDHVALPPYDEIPDAGAIRAAAAGGPVVYRIPNTDIAIVEIEEGRRKGEFLFSAETVDRAREFHERTLSMAPRPGAMKGLYKRVSIAPGENLPRAWIEQLPDWAKQIVLDLAVWKWIALVLILGLWAVALALPYRYSRSRDGDHRYWLRFVLALVAMGLTYFVGYLARSEILLVGIVFEVVDISLFAAIYVLGAFALLNLWNGIAKSIIASRSIDPKKIDAHLIRIVCRVIAWALVIVLLSVGAHRLGIPIEAVVASLGVGGFAFAMAVRPTLENLIAGVTLYIDRPVRVGDFCQFGDVFGSVEEIGLRSTRIRQWGGNLLSVPNSQFADFQLDNYNDMKYVLFRGKFGLRLDTSSDQLRFVLAKLREMLFAHPKVQWPRASFVGFTEHSLKIQLTAYVDTVVWEEYHAVREDIYMRALDIIEQAGAGLAVPIQINYLARDEGIDQERTAAAEEQVKAWRESGELPFPYMPEGRREALKHTLDYPPKGSVDYEPAEAGGPQRERT